MDLKKWSYYLLGLALLQSSTALAAQHTFEIGDSHDRDVVQFTSDAPIELIQGSTSKIKGEVSYDDQFMFDAKHPFNISFKVDLKSIDTGIPLRNEHMRDNFLETGKYPEATFVVKQVKTTARPPFKNAQTSIINATGQFTVHGQTVIKTIPVKVTYYKESEFTHHRFPNGNVIRIQAKFPVSLMAHKIKRPEIVFQKLSETIYVTVDAFGTDAKEAK